MKKNLLTAENSIWMLINSEHLLCENYFLYAKSELIKVKFVIWLSIKLAEPRLDYIYRYRNTKKKKKNTAKKEKIVAVRRQESVKNQRKESCCVFFFIATVSV